MGGRPMLGVKPKLGQTVPSLGYLPETVEKRRREGISGAVKKSKSGLEKITPLIAL